MINLAGQPKEICDAQILTELNAAKIPVFPYRMRQQGEVITDVFGMLGGESCAMQRLPVWEFRRAWYYWRAEMKLPSAVRFTIARAEKFHKLHGRDVRVDGNCTAPSPIEWWGADGVPNHYHIDTQEGLNALVKAILE